MLQRDILASQMTLYVDGQLETAAPLNSDGSADVTGDVASPIHLGALQFPEGNFGGYFKAL